MVRMITPNTNVSSGSIKNDFLQDNAITTAKITDYSVTPAKISLPTEVGDKVLTFDNATGTVDWSSTYTYQDEDVDAHLNTSTATTNQILVWSGTDYDWRQPDNQFYNGLTVGGGTSTFNDDVVVNGDIDLNGDIDISGSITGLSSVTANGSFTLTATSTNNITLDAGGYVFADTDNLYVGSFTQATHITGSSIGAIGNAPDITADDLTANTLTIDDDIEFGDFDLGNASTLPARGMRVVNDSSDVKWSAVQLEDYGGDFADADDKPYNITNPGFHGIAHGGSVASPTALPSGKRCAVLTGHARYGTGEYEIDAVGQIRISAAENQTSTNRGGKIQFEVNPTGGTSLSTVCLFAAENGYVSFAFNPNSTFTHTSINSQGSDTYPLHMDDKTKFNDVVKLANKSSDPATGENGDIYYNNSTHKFRGYVNGDWTDLH